MNKSIQTERLILTSLLERAEAFRREVEKRVRPMIDSECNCEFCESCEFAIDHAEQTQEHLRQAIKACVDEGNWDSIVLIPGVEL